MNSDFIKAMLKKIIGWKKRKGLATILINKWI